MKIFMQPGSRARKVVAAHYQATIATPVAF